MGKTESEISEWLSGNRNFTIDTLSNITHCLGIIIFDLTHMPTTESIQNNKSENKLVKSKSAAYPLKYTRSTNYTSDGWQSYSMPLLTILAL